MTSASGFPAARDALVRPSWRLFGAVGYLLFDIAVLWMTFAAVGPLPPLAPVMLAYLVGYLPNVVPIPGGIGVLDAGLVGALALYGLPLCSRRRGRARLPRDCVLDPHTRRDGRLRPAAAAPGARR